MVPNLFYVYYNQQYFIISKCTVYQLNILVGRVFNCYGHVVPRFDFSFMVAVDLDSQRYKSFVRKYYDRSSSVIIILYNFGDPSCYLINIDFLYFYPHFQNIDVLTFRRIASGFLCQKQESLDVQEFDLCWLLVCGSARRQGLLA